MSNGNPLRSTDLQYVTRCGVATPLRCATGDWQVSGSEVGPTKTQADSE